MKKGDKLSQSDVLNSEMPTEAMGEALSYYIDRSVSVKGEQVEEKFEQETGEVFKFETFPARVNLEVGRTINIGNYNSARVQIGISVPCYTEEIEEAYQVGIKFIKEKIAIEEKWVEDVYSNKKKSGKSSDEGWD